MADRFLNKTGLSHLWGKIKPRLLPGGGVDNQLLGKKNGVAVWRFFGDQPLNPANIGQGMRPTDIYVDPSSGNDANDGSSLKPVKTLHGVLNNTYGATRVQVHVMRISHVEGQQATALLNNDIYLFNTTWTLSGYPINDACWNFGNYRIYLYNSSIYLDAPTGKSLYLQGSKARNAMFVHAGGLCRIIFKPGTKIEMEYFNQGSGSTGDWGLISHSAQPGDHLSVYLARCTINVSKYGGENYKWVSLLAQHITHVNSSESSGFNGFTGEILYPSGMFLDEWNRDYNKLHLFSDGTNTFPSIGYAYKVFDNEIFRTTVEWLDEDISIARGIPHTLLKIMGAGIVGEQLGYIYPEW